MRDKRMADVLIYGVFRKDFFNLLKQSGLKEVFVMEGRPNLTTARWCCRELLKRKITPVLITDNMAGFLFYKKQIKSAWLAYQASSRAGAMCPVGSLIVGVLGKKHKIPIKVFPAQEKENFLAKPDELLSFKGVRIAPRGVKAYVPLVEWLPAKYIQKVFL